MKSIIESKGHMSITIDAICFIDVDNVQLFFIINEVFYSAETKKMEKSMQFAGF